jgi:hypothetical protein
MAVHSSETQVRNSIHTNEAVVSCGKTSNDSSASHNYVFSIGGKESCQVSVFVSAVQAAVQVEPVLVAIGGTGVCTVGADDHGGDGAGVSGHDSGGGAARGSVGGVVKGRDAIGSVVGDDDSWL